MKQRARDVGGVLRKKRGGAANAPPWYLVPPSAQFVHMSNVVEKQARCRGCWSRGAHHLEEWREALPGRGLLALGTLFLTLFALAV